MKKFLLIFLSIFMFFYSVSQAYSQNYDEVLCSQVWCDIVDMPKQKRPKIALVLGGGGARGFAHIGILKVFEEEKIPIDIIVGTSIGAIIGGCYASGMSSDEIAYAVEDIKSADLLDLNLVSIFSLLFREKLFESKKLEKLLNSILKGKKFNELDIEFACVASDIVTGEKVVLRDGDVATAVRASASIPGVFEPVEYKQRYLVDGGIIDNVPADVAKNLGADIIVTVNIESDYTRNELKRVIQVLFQVAYIQGKRLNSAVAKCSDFVLNPNVNKMSVLDMKNKQFAIFEGKKEARLNIDKIKVLIIDNILNSASLQ